TALDVYRSSRSPTNVGRVWQSGFENVGGRGGDSGEGKLLAIQIMLGAVGELCAKSSGASDDQVGFGTDPRLVQSDRIFQRNVWRVADFCDGVRDRQAVHANPGARPSQAIARIGGAGRKPRMVGAR